MNQTMRAGDPVWIAPYDDTWPAQFQTLAFPLRKALGSVALRIDHIGSTAVPGLTAKPILDVQISVADFEPLDAYRVPMEHLGYVFRAANPDLTKRYFREPPRQPRVHFHVRRAGSFSEQFALLFRDNLRTHSEAASQYADLKIRLALQHSAVGDRLAYTEAKGPFIWQMVVRADEWAQRTGWTPGLSDA